MKTTTKKKLMAIFEKYFDVAYDQLRLKGKKIDSENIVIEMINMHYKRVNPLDYEIPTKKTK